MKKDVQNFCEMPLSFSMLFYSFLFCLSMLLLTFPYRNFAVHFAAATIPYTAFLVICSSLTVNCLLQISFGNNQLAHGEYADQKTILDIHEFYPFAMFRKRWISGSLIHVLFLFAPQIPLLFLSGSICALRFSQMLFLCALLYGCALFSRMIGFTVYLLWMRHEMMSFFTVWSIAIFLLLFTAIQYPFCNPYVIIYTVCFKASEYTAHSLPDARLFAGSLFFFIILQFLYQFYRIRKVIHGT